MKILSRIRLRWKLSLFISLLMILMCWLTISVVNTKMKETLLDELSERGVSIARNLAIDSVEPFLVDNRIQLNQLLFNIYNNEAGISYIFIVTPDNVILAHTFKNGFPTDLRAIDHPPTPTDPFHQKFETAENTIYDISYPILKGKAGYVHLGMNDDRQIKKIAIIKEKLLKMALLVTFLGFVVAFLAGRMMGKPLSALADAVKFTGDGEIGPPLLVSSDDEIGILTRKFNKMSENLYTYLSERDAAEKALKESMNLYRSLVQNIDLGITYIDSNYNIVMANDAQGRMFDRDPKSFFGQKCHHEFEKRDGICPHCPGIISMSSGKPSQIQTKGVRDDGSQFTVMMRTFPVTDSDGALTGFIKVVEDISERLQMEEEIAKIRQIESIGVLAGGIAHDFNNLLTAVFGNIELAKMSIYEPEMVLDRLVEAEKAGDQAKHLTNQLLTFSKGGSPIREKISLARFLEEICISFLPAIGVKYHIDIPNDIWTAMLDRNQIERVVMELLENSCDVVKPNEGLITISASNVTVDISSNLPLSPGDYIEMKFTDNGQGIPSNIVTKIFDPYFTTKEMGSSKGTGLGLSICHSIIAKHGGHIKADTLLPGGAEFTIYLPANEEEAKVVTVGSFIKQKEDQEEKRDDRYRILFLEDESVVVNTVSRMLSHLGYFATFVSGGESAILACREAIEAGKPYDIVIMDLSIDDGMGGLEAFRKILSFAPDIKAIVSSGYTDDPVMANFEAYGFKAALPKPFSVGKLEETIQKLIVKQQSLLDLI